MSKGYMYILECADGSYYTGSTKDLERRFAQHQSGEGANYTRKHLPVKLVYYEEYKRIDEAFYREKQVQGWSRKKKEALINGDFDKLSHLAKNYTQNPGLRQAQSPDIEAQSPDIEAQSQVESGTGTEPVEVPDETSTENKTLPEPDKELPESVEGNDQKNNLKGLRYE